MRDQLKLDLVFIASGSIRKPSLGPIVTLGDFMEIYPFGDPLIGFHLTGSQLRRALLYMLREEAFTDGEHCEWYQISRGLCCEYDRATHSIPSLKMNGKEVGDDEVFSAAMERYHYLSIESFLNLRHEELERNGKATEVASRAANVLEEYFSTHELIRHDGEPRLIIHQ